MFKPLLLLFVITSCSNKHEQSISEYQTQEKKIDSFKDWAVKFDSNQAQLRKVVEHAQEQEQRKIIEQTKTSKWRSLPNMFATVFTEGSSKSEVIKVQGQPQLKLPQGRNETFIYGNSEVVFRGDFVSSINDIDGNLRYAGDVMQLAIDPDPIASKFANYLIRRQIDQTNP